MNIVVYGRVGSVEQLKKHTVHNQIDCERRDCTFKNVEVSHMCLDEGVSETIPFEEREQQRKLFEDD